MRWTKLGHVYAPDGSSSWARHSALTPTPWRRDDETIRVFAGLRDDKGVSRIGYVDVDAQNPTRVLRVSQEPVLDVGKPGCFDDNGIILGDVLSVDGRLRMYYVGFQLVEKVKFLAFTGIAESTDNGDSFHRLSDAPIMDRSDDGLYFRAIHSILFEDGKYRAWCGVGSDWDIIDGASFPRYTVYEYQSDDGIHFPSRGHRCLDWEGDEYRIGRPRTRRTSDGYEMLYTVGTTRKTYLPGRAISADGKTWKRCDESVGITTSDLGWDSTHLSYPTVIEIGDDQYMFYNGNNMGHTGFGVAKNCRES